MKEEGSTPRTADRIVWRWRQLKLVLLALFGVTAGQAVVWYAGQFYAMYFLGRTLKMDGYTAPSC